MRVQIDNPPPRTHHLPPGGGARRGGLQCVGMCVFVCVQHMQQAVPCGHLQSKGIQIKRKFLRSEAKQVLCEYSAVRTSVMGRQV